MTLKPKHQTKLALWIILLSTTLAANAQKLPGVQTTSLHAPATVKIDGKATEWNDQLQAYNTNTNIYYSIANDANNLYITFRATDQVIMRKIINNSFTFIINNLADKTPLIISLPIFSASDKNDLSRTLYNKKGFNTDDVIKSTDSLVLMMNQKLEKGKEIKLSGFNGITDPAISVYNEYGIKSKGLFDSNKALTYELAIPRKYINLTSNKLNYTIRLNGLEENTDKNVTVQTSPDGQATISTNSVTGSISVRRNSPETLIETTATNFSGEYELAK